MTLRKTAIQGVKWSTIGVVGASLFQLLQVSILTRFLQKEAFGLVAMALFVVQFTNVFVDMGLTSAILHRQNATKNEYSSIYWLNIGVSVCLYFLLILSSGLVASFYNEQELSVLIPVLGLNLLFVAAGRQHRTLMQKQFKFKEIAITEMISFCVGLATAIFLVVNQFGLYSLVFSTLVASLISNTLFLVYNLRANPISFHFKWNELKPFLRVGGFSLGSTLLDFFSRETDVLIIGKTLGAESLGVYSLSKQIVLKVYKIINPIVINVLNPLLSSIQKDRLRVKSYYLKLINLLSLINFPIYFFLIILSKEILEILYGKNYVDGYLVLSFLSIAYAINSVGNPVGSLQIATGRTDLGFKWTIIRVSLLPLVIYLSSFYGINAVSFSIAIASFLFIIPSWRIMIKPMTKIGLAEYLGQFWKPFLFMILLSAFFVIFLNTFIKDLNLFSSLLYKGITGVFIWLLGMFVFNKREISNLIQFMISQRVK